MAEWACAQGAKVSNSCKSASLWDGADVPQPDWRRDVSVVQAANCKGSVVGSG